jgi:hypothetical protein
MTTANEELTQRICAALEKAKLATPGEIEKLARKIAAGKVKPEDWYAVIENCLPVPKGEVPHGN